MLVVRGKLDNRQAIIGIGVQRFNITYSEVAPIQNFSAMSIAAYRALIDTGAQRTCLTHRTIEAEGLKRHGKKFIKNVHDEHIHSLFMVKLGFWCNSDRSTESNIADNSYFGLENPVEVINIADNDRFDAIVGMDVLSQFDFKFIRGGDFEIELR